MLKLIGAVLTVMVSGFLGIRAAERLKSRYKLLLAFYMLLGEISDKIRVGIPLEEMFSDGKNAKLCERNGYKICPICDGLLSEDKALITEFFMGLGMTDTEAGIARCETYREIIKERADVAKTEAGEKSRLYSLLGLFFGIFISILLI